MPAVIKQKTYRAKLFERQSFSDSYIRELRIIERMLSKCGTKMVVTETSPPDFVKYINLRIPRTSFWYQDEEGYIWNGSSFRSMEAIDEEPIVDDEAILEEDC